jgi:hypothetical protein
MALTTIAGTILTSTGAVPNQGRLIFTRASWDMNSDVVWSASPIEEVLSGSAYSVALESTTDKQIQSAYKVELSHYSAVKRATLIEVLGVIAVPPTGGPFDLPDLLAVPITEPVPADILALCQAYATSADADATDAAASAELARIYSLQAGSYFDETDLEMGSIVIPTEITIISRIPDGASLDQVAVASELSWWKRTTPPTSQPYFTTSGGVVWTQVGYRESQVLSTVHSALQGAYGSVRNFATRADVLSWIALNPAPAIGSVLNWGGLSVRYLGTGTVISDMAGYVPNGDVYADHWAVNTTPGTTNMSAAIQAGMDWLTNIAPVSNGGVLNFFPTIYMASGLQMRNRVFLQGAGRGATSIKLANSTNIDLLTVGVGVSMYGWTALTFDGNRQNNTLGSCINVLATSGSGGDSFAPYNGKVDVSPDSYKHCVAYDFVAGNAAEYGIYHGAKNFQIFYDNFVVSHCGLDGFYNSASDGIFSNFYAEKCDRWALYSSGSNNKFTKGKCIWSARTTPSAGNALLGGTRNTYISVEAQDGYGDGIVITGDYPTLIGCSANRNGYSAVGAETVSSRAHTDWRVLAAASNITNISGRAYTYATAVGTDGFWTTEWPVVFDSYAAAQIERWDLAFDPATYNQTAAVLTTTLAKTNALSLNAFNTAGATFLDISPLVPNGTGAATMRFFRSTATSGAAAVEVYVPNTASVQHRLQGVGNTTLNGQSGDAILGNGAWNGQRVRFGSTYLWIDAAGTLRVGPSAPGSDTAGFAVQRQISSASANFNALADSINTTGKYAGKMVWSTSATRPVFAVGSTAANLWVYADGTTAYTPV